MLNFKKYFFETQSVVTIFDFTCLFTLGLPFASGCTRWPSRSTSRLRRWFSCASRRSSWWFA
jgi:hypothetical protein